MKISRTKRFIAFLINNLANVIIIGLIINFILIFTKSKTIGGSVMGFKHKFAEPILGQLMYFVSLAIALFLYIITLGILWIVDVVKMDKNKGTFAEKFSGCEKIK
ncbi:MAG: hypothetical protein GY679_05560 [Mycoplasma sp.]|nr:hypothetical protein [Mycoplasma sp.]